MRFIVLSLLFCNVLSAGIDQISNQNQTYINEQLRNGLIFEILINNLSAVKYAKKGKIYLKPDRILPSEQGLMLIGDDLSQILLPQVYSDINGCFVKSSNNSSFLNHYFMNCWNCSFQFPADTATTCCPRCNCENEL